jgi:hypothetical protein
MDISQFNPERVLDGGSTAEQSHHAGDPNAKLGTQENLNKRSRIVLVNRNERVPSVVDRREWL